MNDARETRELAWFESWMPTVQSKLEPYARVLGPLYLRSADLQRAIDVSVRMDVLRDALRTHPAEWSQALKLLRSSMALSSIIEELFGKDVPVSVALLALEIVSWEDTEALDAEMGQELQRRETERNAMGKPAYIWVIETAQQGSIALSVRNRSEVAPSALGLVEAIDAG